jgi:hypothetical protein
MTLKEVENTLETLSLRHESLSESTLVVLLRAGGWDEKMVRDAVAIFRKKKNGTGDDNKGVVFLPETQQAPVFPPEIASDHLLSEHSLVARPITEPAVVPVTISEIKSQPLTPPNKHEPPHNLPLKPFDSTSHIWSFEKYKSIFYGDVPSTHEEKVVPTQVLKTEQKDVRHTQVIMQSVPLSKDEQRLVVLAIGTFLVIVLFLGYMYSNGRL